MIISFILSLITTTTFSQTIDVSSFPHFFFRSNVNGSMVQKMPLPKKSVSHNEKFLPDYVGPIARVTNNFNTASLPCCRDRFGEQACQSLQKTQPTMFEKRCLNDHDFHTLDCCSECRKYIEKNKIHPENARTLFKAPTMCRDKHSTAFCRRFKAAGMGKYSCADAEFAVRVCRHSCGYCNDDLYSAMKAAPLCQPISNNYRLN